MRRRIGATGVGGALLLLLGLNAPWAHAALAGSLVGYDCAPELVDVARNRVRDFFGQAQARPWVICFRGRDLGLNVSHGAARFALLLPAIVVIGAEGQNANVLAHELAHAEIAARTGPLLRTYKIPTWFDEGLAMQLDHRPHYSRGALYSHLASDDIKRPRLGTIDWPNSFYQTGDQGEAHYALSKCVIEEWLGDDPLNKANGFLSAVAWNWDFPTDDFRQHESACTSLIPTRL